MVKKFNFLNKIGLLLAISTFFTGVVFYEFTSVNLILTTQLLLGSIASIAVFSALNTFRKKENNLTINLYLFGYLVQIFLFVSLTKTELLSATWHVQLAAILLLLFTALDFKLSLTSFYDYQFIKWIYRISVGTLIICTILKVNSSLILSLGVFILMILSIISITSNIFLKTKSKED
jgi:hypothetical protein